MSNPTEPDFEETLSIATLVATPFNVVLENWVSFEPRSPVSPALLARAPIVLETVRWLTSHPAFEKFRLAVVDGDERALGALELADAYLREACGILINRCIQWKSESVWTALRSEAELAARLAAATGQDDQRARALFLLANAHRAHNDVFGTIAAYEGAIEAASAAGDVNLLAAANDNLGLVMTEAGRLDEALSRYEEALRYERSADGRAAIFHNKAGALAGLGELRSASRMLQENIKELERAGVVGQKLALTLDSMAVPLLHLGEPATALSMLERASTLLIVSDLKGRAVNALLRSVVHVALDDKSAAADAFCEAHDLAFQHARESVDPEHYRQGFYVARTARLPSHDEANRLFERGVAAKNSDEWALAFELWQKALNRAQEAGDYLLALRVSANAAALFADRGQVEPAIKLADEVRHEASKRGLALPEFMVVGTLGSLAARGSDIPDSLGPLGAYTRGAILLEVHTRIVTDAGLDPTEAASEVADVGSFENELALLAERHHADDLAARYFRDAVSKARGLHGFHLANRLAGLRAVLARSGEVQEEEAVAQELGALLDMGNLPGLGELVARRALAAHLAESDRQAAIDHLQRACEIAENLRQRVAPGSGRADVDRQYSGLFRELARLLRLKGDVRAAFEALQGVKGRRLIAALAARVEGRAPAPDAPPKIQEVAALLGELSDEVPTVLVDLAVEEEGLTAYLVEADVVKAIHVHGTIASLNTAEQGDVRERETRLVALCLHDPLLRGLAEAVTNSLLKGRRLLIVPDLFLHNLPMHITPVKGRPWCDQNSIGYIQGAGTLRFAPQRQLPGGNSLVAGDSRGDLPQAAAECHLVAAALRTVALIGQRCTRAAIEQALRAGALDIVHLAMHGRGDARRGGRASLLFSNGSGGTEWVDFDELTTFAWRAKLVVFSGCSTGVFGSRHGHQLISVAAAALEAGAASVIACLWPVGDEAAAVCMKAFYEGLVSRRHTAPVDLRLVLEEACSRLRSWLASAHPSTGRRRRDGRRDFVPVTAESREAEEMDPSLANALAWGPFVLMGYPILAM